jgi:chorismate mutase/prephenate dehydratase
MPPSSTSDLAGELDALDDKIHDFLMRRAALAVQSRPASQAKQSTTMRRLAARHDGAFPLAVLVRIWREIMASVPGVAPQVHVFAGDKVADYRDLARAYFGSVASMESHPSASAVIHACAGDTAAFGLVPPPDSDENERPWWVQLSPSGQRGPRVIARLPLVGPQQSGAYAIGSLEQEPTGADTTLIILEANAGLSRTKLQALIREVGFEAQLVAVGRDSARSNSRQHLLEIAGFVPSNDSRLGVLLEQAGDTIQRLVCVGGYADPVPQPEAI